MKKLIYALASLIILLGSCAKETVHVDPGTDAGFSLGGTNWNLIASTSVINFGQDKMEIDLYAMIPECGRDDLMIFHKNNTVTGSPGKLECPQNYSNYGDFGTWKLSEDKKLLELSSKAFNAVGSDVLKCEILAMNETNLQMKYQTTTNGIVSVTTSSYKRIK